MAYQRIYTCVCRYFGHLIKFDLLSIANDCQCQIEMPDVQKNIALPLSTPMICVCVSIIEYTIHLPGEWGCLLTFSTLIGPGVSVPISILLKQIHLCSL